MQLKNAFWRGLKKIATWRDMSLPELIAAIDCEAHDGDLPRAIRLFVLNFYRHQMLAADHLLRSVAPLPTVLA